MRIAFIIPYIPNPIRTRSYNLIKQLAALGHEVELFTLFSNGQDLVDAEALRQVCSEVRCQHQPTWRSLMNCLVGLPTRQPLQAVYSWNPGLADSLVQRLEHDKTSREIEVVHVEHLRGSRYGAFLKENFPTLPIVWDSVDSISYLFEQAASRSRSVFGRVIPFLELSKTQRAEGNLVCRFDHVLVTSQVDREALLKLVPNEMEPAPVAVLPNGVDLEYFHPNPDFRREMDTLILSGKMSYHANISMAKFMVYEIMPKIWQQRPGVRLLIVGKDPPGDVKKLAENPLITVTGTVDDIRPYLWSATVAVVPLVYGAGIQNKVLEAMASAIPVVATSRTTNALQTVPGRDILTADSPEEFSIEVLRLLNNPNLQKVIGDAGLNYVRVYHSWKGTASRLVDIYQEAIAKSG